MTTLLRQSLAQKLGELPDADIAEVLDFVDFLIYKQNKKAVHQGIHQDIHQAARDSYKNSPPQSVQKLRTSRFIGAFEADPDLASQSQAILRNALGDRQGIVSE